MSTEAERDGWPEGYDLVILDEVDSTMTEAARRAGLIDRPTWIMARHQTAARGRRGRSWAHPAGNLAATLVFHPDATPAEAARRSFLAANALFEALAIYVDRGLMGLKWPNDVLLSGGKVAGILLESAGTGPFIDWLSIGVGVNLVTVPVAAKGDFPPVSLLGEGGESVAPEVFLTTLASAYATQEDKLRTFGFARIRADWLRHAVRLGETITARTARDEITGIFETVDDDGALVLREGGTRHVIPAADVYF
ncbi:MAG: biotin--[acetyl-CoA-carboxylase] ligase [Limimaricola sp.]|uniref:biotin--[acetyl-CoA-carboxylase] ligase n=1 Tax=Limimaricola sp. TaxID=2211665 RepID=UPI001DDB29D1|nr:biotin--[acetyl-CoA-carboxylase] ligase [Limimaricola sp.]MBI1418481.1 biotin--[acetyl-CoA-carboxylase] ligase [Limimaricola sp.]